MSAVRVFVGAAAVAAVVLGCGRAPATVRLADLTAPPVTVGWLTLPVGGVYGSPALVWNHDGNLVLILSGRGVHFSDYTLRVHNERSETVPLLSYQIDEHLQVRSVGGVAQRALVSTWSAVLPSSVAGRRVAVTLTRNHPHHYEIKWERVEIPLGATFVH